MNDFVRGSIDGSANAPLTPIASRIPKLDDLPEGLQRKARSKAIEGRLVAEADRRLTAETEDYPSLVEEFLRTRKAEQTRIRYRNGIRRWTAWCAAAGIHPLLATPKDADLFAAQLEGAPASVNSTISAVSSFYSTLYKWEKITRTPFVKVARRGERPSGKHIPSAAEVRKILEACG